MAIEIDLSGKFAVVTGAARGIGRSIALTLAEAGARVLVNDLVKEEMEKVVQTIRERGGESFSYQADVSIKDQVEGLIEEAVRLGGNIDILVNNAGILRVAPFLETREKDWDDTLAINLKGTFLCSQAAARYMVGQKWGRIINMASVVGKIPRINNTAYCVSKAGIIHLSRVMALELVKYGITVNSLCPGPTETEMIVKVQAKGDPQLLEKIIRGDLETHRGGIPMGRLARPEELASLVVFLASEKADYITGQSFTIDGGHVMI